MAFFRTYERIKGRLYTAWHAAPHILATLGFRCELPFGPKGEGVTELLIRGASDLARRQVGYSDWEVRDYEEEKFRPTLPILHLAKGVLVALREAEAQHGRKVTLVELSHSFEALKDILAVGVDAAAVVKGVWRRRTENSGQIGLIIAA
jgi:hypothetical protein